MAGGYSGRYCPPTAASANGSLGFHRHGPLWATAATANCRIVAICVASRGAAKTRAAAKAAACSVGSLNPKQGCNILIVSGTLSSSKSPKGLGSKRTYTRCISDAVHSRVYHGLCYTVSSIKEAQIMLRYHDIPTHTTDL